MIITARLRAKLDPVELALYGGGLIRDLTTRAYHYSSGELVDGWSCEDFVGWALERAVRTGNDRPGILGYWMGLEYRKRAARAVRRSQSVQPRSEEVSVPELSLETRAWLYDRLDPRTARAIQWVSEQGLSVTAAAEQAGIDRRWVQRGLELLRSEWDEDG